MAKAPNFTKIVPPPATASTLPPPPPPPPGGIYPAGKLILSDYTRRQLQTLGWKEGDPIPDERFAQRIAQVQAAVQREIEAGPDIPLDRPPVRPSKVVELSSLPPERQAELRAALQEYNTEVKQQMAEAAAEAAANAHVDQHAHPSIQAAQRTAAQAMGPSADVVFEPQPPKAAPRPAVTALPPTPPVAAPTAATPAATPPEPSEPATSAGALPQLTHCPRCSWDLKSQFKVEPTDADRTAFVAALMGMTRFEKTYPLFGGQMSVTYRSLLAKETNLLFKTLGQEVRAGEINGDGEYMMQLMDYRLAMSVAVLKSEHEVLQDIPPIFDIPCDKGDSPLPKLLQWFNEEAVVNESLRRVVGQQHREFQRLVEALEAQTSEPDFWKGIALPR